MLPRLKFLFLLAFVSGGLFASVGASAQSIPEIGKAETYLNSLKSVKSRFLMTGAAGLRQYGTFYLKRPGKLRFDFDAPVEDFIVADGRFLYFYDAELGAQSNAPIGSTLADFLLRPNIDLSDELAVTRVMRGGGLLQISIVQGDDPEAGTLILGFREAPFALEKWRVVDSLGNITEIELLDMQRQVELENKLFYYMDPNKNSGSYNE